MKTQENFDNKGRYFYKVLILKLLIELHKSEGYFRLRVVGKLYA